ncbi:hypothetical protein JW935_04660 [candidate division KSB1 bacterium]|nr:hypothetical protein [candidate division KSB1 bacterium]
MRSAVYLCPDNALYHAYTGLVLERSMTCQMDIESLIFKSDVYHDSVLQTAIFHLQKAVQLAPCDANWQHGLAWLNVYNHHPEIAGYFFKQAVAHEPYNPVYLCSLGLWWEKQAQMDSAILCFQKCITSSPSVLDSRLFSSLKSRNPYFVEKSARQAIERMELLMKHSSDPITVAKLGRIYYFCGDTCRASDYFRNAVLHLPNLNRPYFYLAMTSHDRALKEALFRKAYFLDQRDYLPTLALANFYYNHGKYDAAKFYYARTLINWHQITSDHAKRLYRMYYCGFMDSFSKSILRDDVIPNGYLAYINPSFDWREIRDKLVDSLTQMEKHEIAKNVKNIQMSQLDEIENLVLKKRIYNYGSY